MPKYFSYRKLDDLRADVAQRGIDVRVEDDTSALLHPVRVGPFALGNRLAVHPMEGCDGTPDGRPGELTYRRWERFGGGGAKLIWGEATAVVPEARANPRQLLLTRETAPDFQRLLEGARGAHRKRFGRHDDLAVGLQLTHSGRWSYPKPLIARHAESIDALKHVDADDPVLTDEYLEALEDQYVEAAVLAARVGFDFVDVKECHTYLLNELLAARSRPGIYGGSWENRTRFIRNVSQKIHAVAPELALASRLNAYDGPVFRAGEDGLGEPVSDAETPFGTEKDGSPSLDEPIALVGLLHELGFVMVNVSMGSPYWNPHIGRPFERAPVDGYTPPEHPLDGVERHFRLTAAIQKAYPEMAIVGTGYSWLRHYAANAGAANVKDGRVTLMGLGRGALAYPDFAADLMEQGQMIDKKSCIGVSYCTALMRAKHNDLGQFPAGCVPRDPLYVEHFKRATEVRG